MHLRSKTVQQLLSVILSRYLALLEENPELLQYVPLKHIASYLWITPQSLSRIRAGLGKQKKING